MNFTQQVHAVICEGVIESMSGGQFAETVCTSRGLQITYRFPLATGMAWQLKRSLYSAQFGQIPSWLNTLHPTHRTRLCDLSLIARYPLPESIDEEVMGTYIVKYQSFGTTLQALHTETSRDLEEGCSLPDKSDLERVIEFDVNDSGTLTMANFWEPKIRSDFYESVHENWFQSPADLALAMDECQPLTWAVQSIYIEVRDEIQSNINVIRESCATCNEKTATLEAQLELMPEEPEDGVKSWLLALNTMEFESLVVPEIAAWFNSSPNWGWEEDYLPKDATAQGAALRFFQNLDGDVVDSVGVIIVEGEHPGSTYYAAVLKCDVEAANKVASNSLINIRFRKGGK